MTNSNLVPRLHLGTHCLGGSASRPDARQTLAGSAFPGGAWERYGGALALWVFLTGAAPLRAQDSLHTDVGPLQTFTLNDRSGKPFKPEDLRGKVWVAHLFYTTCAAGCSKTTALMAELQKIFRGKRDIALVSISLNPDNDTPETLAKFAADLNADPQQWFFLSGAQEKDVHDLVQKNFRMSAGRVDWIEKDGKKVKPEPGFEIGHDFALLIVDREGRIRGYNKDAREQPLGPLADRLRSLVYERYRLPAINAGLNGLCTLLLLAGYVAIRRRKEGAHKACMLAALAVSALFLTLYLYYHFAILDGKPTRFPGEGWVRTLYFVILLSHTALAVVVAPLAIYVAVQGLKDRRPRHVKLARWTLPVWLYVSITGVVVYWMLYRLYPPA